MFALRLAFVLGVLLLTLEYFVPLLLDRSPSARVESAPNVARPTPKDAKPLSSISSDIASDTVPMSAASSASSIRRMAPLVMPAVGRHTATVIFVHGLGDTGHGWVEPVNFWRTRQSMNEIKFILPHAPHIPITMNGGMPMPGWFDIKTLTKGADEDGPGVLQSREYLHGLIQQEIRDGIPADRIVLGGFSQGGAMSIFSGLTAPVKIGGIVGLSSWLLLSQKFKDHVPSGNVNGDTPIFMGHGDRDPLVLYDLAKESEKALTAMGYSVTFKTYRGMLHQAWPEELNDVEAFLGSRLPPKGQ
ncbi:lysophospholipase [Metarhizium album ARSEF 1941]|uniref:Acyl-protein thioesterase 1 n=1 Tax=Metarhizium album (strain ARSEF 1941) TaxID=1081103 RepID=A0A0B2WX18_METAS|nr:lysophospholipase [Metarhizium album ARSEF 1941]KHN97982.1 lysophospholipase [Metarhizium album ARSEF 1941]